MGTWKVDTVTEPGILRLKLVGVMAETEMKAFVEAHDAAVDSFAGSDYKVWCDISEMGPLDVACADLFERAKRHSASKANFRGSAVKVSSALVALQHRRTSTESGVMSTELISDDESALREHLRRVHRKGSAGSGPPRTPSRR